MSTLPSTLTASEARINLYDMLEEVQRDLKRFIITHRGKPQAVVMPIEDVESLEETIEIMSDKKLMRQIKKAEQEFHAGKGYTLEEVEQMLRTSSKTKRKTR